MGAIYEKLHKLQYRFTSQVIKQTTHPVVSHYRETGKLDQSGLVCVWDDQTEGQVYRQSVSLPHHFTSGNPPCYYYHSYRSEQVLPQPHLMDFKDGPKNSTSKAIPYHAKKTQAFNAFNSLEKIASEMEPKKLKPI